MPIGGSAFDDVDGQAALAGFFVFRGHVEAGLAHGFDDLIERNFHLVCRMQSKACGVDGFDCADGIALDTGDLPSPPTGSQVSPRLCSMPISAALATCIGVAPQTAARPPAAIEQATPTSP